MLPRLTVNEQFMRDFITAVTPCCALGVIEERNRKSGLLALRINNVIPNEVSNNGFRFGHSLYGSSSFEVVHFAFEFYNYKSYNVLINPNNPVAQEVLAMMIENGGYFFLVINPDNSVIAFRSEIEEEILNGLKTNILRIKHSRTTDDEYQKTVRSFEKNPQPSGEMLQWVCYNNIGYLDLTKDLLELKPSR